MTDDECGRTGPEAGRLSQEDVDVGLRQFVDADGDYDPATLPDLDPADLVELYRWLLTERVFDERMVTLQRRGDLGTYASGRGQEASIVGAGYALADDDWLLGMGRETRPKGESRNARAGESPRAASAAGA